MEIPRPRWSSDTKRMVFICIAVVAAYLIYKFSSVIPPVILAIILAFVLTPIVNKIQARFKWRRVFVVLAVYLVMILLVVALLMLIIPMLIEQARIVILDSQILIRQAATLFDYSFTIGGFTINGQQLFQELSGMLRNGVAPAFSRTIVLLADIISGLVWIIFILIISFYLVKDSDVLQKWLESLPPPGYLEDYQTLRSRINTIWSSFFRGQLLLSFVVAVIITLINLIIGLPFALLLGVFAGMLEFMPSVGHGIYLVMASVVALFGGSNWLPIPNWAMLIIVITVHIVFTQFDLNYLIPRIIGQSVHLPPVVVILGIIVGAALAGVLGVVLAAPTIASLRVIIGYIYCRLFDLEPFREGVISPLPPPNVRWWRKTSRPLEGQAHFKTSGKND
jgi:predicted PurR-regulated permease PerM